MNTATKVHFLGTAGGPAWWPDGYAGQRRGIATAIEIGGQLYLVDFGDGASRQLARTGLNLADMRAGFITHLHSDHVVDVPSFLLFGLYEFDSKPIARIPIFGPGERTMPPAVSAFATSAPDVLYPEHPMPGTESLFAHLLAAYATDVNERVIDSLRVSPCDIFQARDIPHPLDEATAIQSVGSDGEIRIAPFRIYEDDRVRVTATLVRHPPVWPAYAFRFDTDNGSVVISGDTARCDNLIELAAGADLLVHEAIDPEYIEQKYGDGTDAITRASKAHHYRAHTLPEEAGVIANLAGVKFLALNHLVPGNSERRVWEAASRHFHGPIYIPNDLDMIELGATA